MTATEGAVPTEGKSRAVESVLEHIDLKLLQENIQRLFEAVFYAVDDYGRPLRAAFMDLP